MAIKPPLQVPPEFRELQQRPETSAADTDQVEDSDLLLRGWTLLDGILKAASPYILAAVFVYLAAHILVSFFAR